MILRLCSGQTKSSTTLFKEIRRWIKADLSDSTQFVIELFNLHKKLLESP
jgi:hypothetical protein